MLDEIPNQSVSSFTVRVVRSGLVDNEIFCIWSDMSQLYKGLMMSHCSVDRKQKKRIRAMVDEYHS